MAGNNKIDGKGGGQRYMAARKGIGERKYKYKWIQQANSGKVALK